MGKGNKEKEEINEKKEINEKRKFSSHQSPLDHMIMVTVPPGLPRWLPPQFPLLSGGFPGALEKRQREGLVLDFSILQLLFYDFAFLGLAGAGRRRALWCM